MAPRGSYRTCLEAHLSETREHAARVARRRDALGQGGPNPLMVAVGAVETVLWRALALGKTPIDLLRGSGGEEKVLKNAKDACATEALEIATYTALERLARSVGDAQSASPARDRRLRAPPSESDVEGQPSYEVTETGAADAVRDAAEVTKRTARQAR